MEWLMAPSQTLKLIFIYHFSGVWYVDGVLWCLIQSAWAFNRYDNSEMKQQCPLNVAEN